MRAAAKAPLWRREAAPRRPLPGPQGEQPWQAIGGLTAAFLLGYLPGILAGRTGAVSLGGELAAYYMDGQSYIDFAPAFFSLLSTAFLQLTLTMLCGFSALGIPGLTALFLLRGGFLGLGAASVYTQGGAKALIIHWLLRFLPDLALLVLTLWLAGSAVRLAGRIFRDVFCGGAPRSALSALARHLLVRYMAAVAVSIILCLVGTGMDLIFAGALL